MAQRLDPIQWRQDHLLLLDQRILPHQEEFVLVESIQSCHEAIKDMVVRGAPCIGFTAIFGMALFARLEKSPSKEKWQTAANYLKSARPTAINLAYEVDRCFKLAAHLDFHPEKTFVTLAKFGQEQMALSGKNNLAMAQFGLEELKRLYGNRKLSLMTHCNTGYLACGSLGTALGVISHGFHQGHVERVWADETRPYMQGTRLTSYELLKENIPHKIVVEGAASELMRKSLVDAIFVGADRIVRNGDTANKVGTATLALVAKHYGVPFFVVAPTSSFDMGLNSGDEIEIEERPEEEITCYQGKRVAANSARAFNPSFDVTRGDWISGIISERGIVKADYKNAIAKTFF